MIGSNSLANISLTNLNMFAIYGKMRRVIAKKRDGKPQAPQGRSGVVRVELWIIEQYLD